MASSIIAKYREHLASQGKDSTQTTDKDLALELYSALTEQKKDFEKFAENRGDPEFAQLVRDAYEENKTFKGSAVDSIPAEYYNRKTGLQRGLSVGAGAVGMDDTARDLMRDANRNERKANKYQKNIFNDIQMIDDPIDGLKYVTQAITSTAVSVVPDMALSLITRGAGGKIQKSLEKGGKLKDVRKKLEKTMGEGYGKNIGTVAGAFGTSAVENTGHVYGDLYEYTKLDPSDEKYLSPSEARALSMVGGGASATLDSVLPVWLVGKLSKSIGADAAQKEVTKMFNGMPEGMVLLAKGTAGEGVTEGLQEVVQMLTVKYHTDEEWSPQDWNRLINASVMGAIGGGAVTGGTAAIGRMLEAPETRPWDPKLEEVDTKKEREEIRNRNALRRYADLEVGTIVSPAGSDKLARVVSKNEEDSTVVVEFRDGLTQRMDPTKLNVKQDKKRVIKEEDLESFSDQKLEELKIYSPKLTSAIEKEQERRNVEVEKDNTLKRLDTAIEVSEKGNQIIAVDSSSKERIHSATFTEEDGLLVLDNESKDSENDQRGDQARELIHKQLKAKAKKLGMPYKIGDVIEYPLSASEINQIDSKADLLVEYGRLRARYNLLGRREPETEERLIARMQELGMISLDRNNRPILGEVELKKGSNSRLLTTNPEVASVLSGSIFTDLEANLVGYEDTLNASQINDKFILKEAKAMLGDMAETIDGLNHSDVARIAEGATELFKKHYLDEDGGWKAGKTRKDIEDEEAERQEIALMRKQESKDRFDLIKPQVGNFVQIAKGQAPQKITSVDEENFTVRTTEGGDNDISARSIIRQAEERPLERNGEFVTELNSGKVRKKVVVTGSDTNGEYRGRKSLTVTFEKNGDIISVTDSENNYYSDAKGLSVDDDEFQSTLASITLTKVEQKDPPTPKPQKVADNIFRIGNTIEGSVLQVNGSKKIGKHELVPVLTDNTGRVSGIKVGDEELTFDDPVPASEWVETARTKLKAEGMYGRQTLKPTRVFRKPKNELLFRSRNDSIITPPINIKTVEVDEEDPAKGFDELLADVDKSKLSESKSTKTLIALRYFYPGSDQPAILLRRVASSKGDVVIRDMKRKGGKTLDPLTDTSSYSIKMNSDQYYDALEGDERIEPVALLEVTEEVNVNTDFDTEQEFNLALDPFLDKSKVRLDPMGILEGIDTSIEQTDDPEVEERLRLQRNRIETMVQDEDGQFNPLLEIFGFVPDNTISSFKEEIEKRLPAIKDKQLKAKGRKILKSDQLRILDVTEFLGGIAEKKGSWRVGIRALGDNGEEYQSLDKVITTALNEFSKRGYKPRAEKGTGTDAMSRAVTSLLDDERVSDQTGDKGFSDSGDIQDENDIEGSQLQDSIEQSEADEVTLNDGLDSYMGDGGDEQPMVISDVEEPIDQIYVEMAENAIANPKVRPEDKEQIKFSLSVYKNSNPTERESKREELVMLLVEAINMANSESVGEIASTPDVIEREIASSIEKPTSPPPLAQELIEENSVSLQKFFGGAVMDGEPIRLEAYINRMLNTIVGEGSVDSDILDMAQQLMSHPYAKDLNVKFESWDNFKKGVSSDGRNGKITRAYLRGNTIVMGPFYKLKLDSDLTADDHIRVTLLEEIAHSVLDKAVNVAVLTNRLGELPADVRGVISKEKADKLYRETEEIMSWLRTQTDGRYYQGLLNKKEFWANFATNPDFRKFLNRPMPPQLRRKFQSRFERVIDWLLDLASKIFDADFTRQASTLDVIRKRYRTVLRTADKLAAADVDIYATMNSESRGNINSDLGINYNIQDGKTQDKTFSSLPKIIATTENLSGRDGKDSFYRAAVDSGYEITRQNLRKKLEGLPQKIGTEHGAYFDHDAGRAIKVTRIPESMMSFGHFYDVGRYIRDKHNMNLLFGDDIQFVGVSPREDGDYAIITSQPLILGREATSDEIIADLEGRGYKITMTPNWEDNGATQEISAISEDGTIELSDIAPKNVLVDNETGELAYIDVHVEAPNDLASRVESADTFDPEEASVAQGTIRAHMTALMDLGNVISSALTEVGEESSMSVEKIKEYQVVKDGSTPEVIAKVLADKAASVDEVLAQYRQALPEQSQATAGLDNINNLESIANRDTAARNLMKLLVGTRESASDLLGSSLKNYEKLNSKLESSSDAIARLTSPKTMFDASKTQRQLAKAMRDSLYKQNDSGEGSKVNSFEAALIAEGKDINLTDFRKLRGMEIDEGKLFSLLEKLSVGFKGVRFIEQLTAEEIFDALTPMSNAHSLVTNSDPDTELDQAVKIGIALILGRDQRNSVPRSAFTTRLRLAKGEVSHEIADAVRLIKDAANGRPVRDIKDRSMRSIIENVKSIKADIDEYKADLEKVKEEIRVGEIHLKVYDERIADLDEYFETSAPVELREGGQYSMLEIDADGKLQETLFTFRLGNGESSEEAKYTAAKASELNKIMQTESYKQKYGGTPMDRYFKQLVTELRKPNFGIQYHTAHVGFLHAMAQSLQERLSNLGPAGKLAASLLNTYNRDYNAEVGAISSQGKKVSKAIKRLHGEMARESGENLNQFIKGFGSKMFDWFNERPDLQGQEEQAINKVWSDLKKEDPTRQYTEEGKRALRAYLKQWGIQNDNFRRLYKKYDIKVEDENVPRGELALGVDSPNLFRDFVEQGVFTTPRKLNRTKIFRVVSLLDSKFAEKDYVDEESDGNFFGKALASMQEARASGVDMEESFQQIFGKSVSPELSSLFFSPIFNGKSAHNIPFVLQSQDNEGRKSKRILLPEELQRAWRNADGNNEGIRVANAILSLSKIIPGSNEDTLFNLVGQMKHRASALIKVERESRQEDTAIDNNADLMRMLKGSDFHHSIHGRALYNVLPGEFFEYEMYDETSSSQHLSKIMMTAHFGRKGEKLADNFKAIKEQYVASKDAYADYAQAAGVSLRGGRPPSRNIFGYAIKVRKIKAEMANRGKDPNTYSDLETKAKAFYEAENSIAATSAAFTSRSSNNADLSMGLDALRALAFGLVNTMKGAWTSIMSMPDIVKKMGLNPTAFRTLGGAVKNLPQEIAGSFLESFGIEMIRPDKYNEELRDMYGREQGMLGFDEFTTEIGKEGSLGAGQGTFRKIVNVVQGLSQAGGSMRSKTSVNFIPGSVLTPFTAPFSYLAQAVNKSISLSMAETIERFVLRAVEAMETKGITIDNNTFEVSAKDLGYEDSKLDSWVFGSVDMVEKLNQRLTAEGMSFAQLAQDYRRRKELDPNAKVLSVDAVRASQNIAMSEVTYDTMAGKPSAALSGVGQFFSPLLSWSASSYSKGLDQMRNKEGRLAMRESVRYMLTASAWLMPVGIAFTMFMDWWDEEVLGKPSSLRKVPPIAMVPGIGTFMAMTDPRYDVAAMLERAARANNILGLGQEFITPMLVGQLDPSSLGAKFDPTRRVLGISTVMNAYAVATNYFNAIRTGGKEEIVPDYATVVRPLMYLMGLNAVIQNTQAATNLTSIEDIEPTGFMTNERQVADITGMRNSFRVFAKAIGMEMRRGGIMQFSATAMGNALKRMERAAYANDRQAFKDAYRRAIELSQSDDKRKDVSDKFKKRHIRNGVTRYSMSDADIQAILSVMDPDQRSKILTAMRNHDFYLKAIGGTPSKPRKDVGQYKEALRKLAL